MLKMEIRVGESIKIGDAIITLEDKSGKVARLSIKASPSVSIVHIGKTSAAHFAKQGIAPQK
jgi:sRNA-binding carbon storage regulator CsrA